MAELAEAKKNRGADVGVFVLAASSRRENPRIQAEFPRALMRQGMDIVAIWDPDDRSTDVALDAAVTLARALLVRERAGKDAAAEADWDQIDKAILGVEKQIAHIDDLDGWCGNIKRDADKISDRLEKMKKDLKRELERLSEEIENLRP